MILNGKRVLITGGAKRVGAAVAVRLARSGCRVALHCRSSVAEGERLLSELPGSGHSLHVMDLTPPGAPERLCREVGTFELLVNNASVFFRPGSPEDAAASELYFRLNFHVPAELLTLFSAQNLPEGAAVNLTDCAVLTPGAGAYYESKLALARLTESLAVRWGPENLRINAIAPGAVLPPAWAPASRMTKILAATPLHRAVAPSDIADLVEFTFRCDSLTGAVIPLDGALHLLLFEQEKK